MTLDIAKFMTRSIEKQMKIQHFDASIGVFAKDSIPENVSTAIKSQFGDDFLEDSNYVVFFKGGIDKDDAKKLFNITNKALGEDANRLVEGDIKKLKLAGQTSEEPAEEPADDIAEEPDDEEIVQQPPQSDDDDSDNDDDEVDFKAMGFDAPDIHKADDEENGDDEDNADDVEPDDEEDDISDEEDNADDENDDEEDEEPVDEAGETPMETTAAQKPMALFFLKVTTK